MSTPKYTPYTYLNQCYDSTFSTKINLLIDTDIVKTFMPYLNPHEKIVWTAKAGQGLIFRPMDIFYSCIGIIGLIVCSILFYGIFQSFDSLSFPENIFTGMFVLIFLGIDFYVLIGRYFADIMRRSKVVYAISDNRIFIRSGIFSKDIDIIEIHKLETLHLKQGSQNIGTILLSRPPKKHWYHKRNNFPEMAGYDGILKFEKIEKVHEVYKLLNQLQAQGLSNS